MATDPRPSGLRRWVGPGLSAVMAAAWVLLALRRPDATFHAAPLLVAASWGAAQRTVAGAPGSRLDGVLAAVGGIAVGGTATLVLWAADALRGPTLWHSSAALGETVLALLLGAALSARFVLRHRPGLLFSG